MEKLKKIYRVVFFALISTAGLTSCYEKQHVQQYHHHTREWYDRHGVLPGTRYGDPSSKKFKALPEKDASIRKS